MDHRNDDSPKYEARAAATPEGRQALLAAIVESTDDAIVSKDLNGIIVTWNDAAARMFGYSAQEIIGKSVRCLIPEELQHEEEVILAKIHAGQRISHYETVRVRKNGERFDASITISPLINREGQIIGASKIARDITERKQLEKQLIQSEKLAATGRMAATVAHEINSPLDSVLNLLYLARKSLSSAEARSLLSTAESELERVAQIARQTLGYYRDDGTPTAVVLQDIVENVLTIYQGKIASAGIATECRFEDHPLLLASKGELMQIFSNIVANAIDAMPQGGVLRIRTQRCIQPDGIEIQLVDNGSGIRKEDLAKVFEPFFTTKGNLGTGIGLWVVKQLVEKTGGHVTVTSNTDIGASGTTVSIFLPLRGPANVEHDTVN
ncbi:MAG TPA: PAS domain S-box protein [Terracidiphilus sp.]|jgi:PAS domain S-box-containing protein